MAKAQAAACAIRALALTATAAAAIISTLVFLQTRALTHPRELSKQSVICIPLVVRRGHDAASRRSCTPLQSGDAQTMELAQTNRADADGEMTRDGA